jgi:hypothetical protein
MHTSARLFCLGNGTIIFAPAKIAGVNYRGRKKAMEEGRLMASGVRGYWRDGGEYIAWFGFGSLFAVGAALIFGVVVVALNMLFSSSGAHTPPIVAYGALSLVCTAAGFASYFLYKITPAALEERGRGMS